MENQQPPIRIISPGRVYRPDTVDATHYFMFHQVEGLYVDQGVTMSDLKTALDQFCKAYFGPDVATRLRPSFFPFTEPSAEIDVQFHNADGTRDGWSWRLRHGRSERAGRGRLRQREVHRYAFGMGIERMALRKHGITDIRLLYESDVRFLHQF